ncbi:MAG TPA: Ig-like domain repeat protein [Gemmatimonadales bacterium]|nr:Ig-like domain repeat protein [Gemmatimonadales bacterium]
MTTARRRFTSLIAFGLATAATACGGDGIVLPDESRPAAITRVGGDLQTAAAGATLLEPLTVLVTDALNRPVEGQTVAFTIDAGGGQVAPASVTTTSEGKASTSWTLGAASGQQRVQAKVDGTNVPATLLVKFSASAVSGNGALLQLVSGDNQSAAVGSALPESLVVRVTDQLLNPVAGVQVDWSVGGGGSISPASVVTGADGLAAAERVLGSTSGTQTALASSGFLTPVTFTHTADPANPTALILVSGDAQIGSAGAPLPAPLVVRLEDGDGNGVGGKSISWVVATGGGSVAPATATTNPNGFAETQWTLGPGSGSNLLNAVFSGLPSVPFSANAQAGAPVKLAFTLPPVTTGAGTTISPAVRVAIQDAAGNTVTTATDAVTLAIATNPAGGALSGTTTVNAVNGVAVFSNLSIDKVGSGYQLSASSGTLTGATSPTFDILTGTANRLVILSGPSDRIVGQLFSPAIQVQVQDAAGNPVITALSPISITSSVTGTLVGNATVIPVLGTATFTNLAINRANPDYTLTALSSNVASATSDEFDVAKAPTTIAIVQFGPSSSVPGQNVTVNYDVNIPPPGAGTLFGTVTVTDGVVSCTGGLTAGAGTGSCPLPMATAGSHQVTATYSGNANFVESTSSAVDYTVNKANTTISILPETPDPSVIGQPVTLQWNLSSAGSTAPSGNVVLTVAGGSETCSQPAALGGGSCSITFQGTGSRQITATYAGDGNYNGASDTENHQVVAANVGPVANDDSYSVLEDGTLSVNPSSDVLENDTDSDNGPQPLSAAKVTDPAHGTVSLAGNGTFTYTPDPDFSGTDSFTYSASDGALSSTATVTITVTPVNDAPSFTKGSDQNVSPLALTQTIVGWASAINPGPNESGQAVTFEVSTDDDSQFFGGTPPQISSLGTLVYTPNPLSLGATVTVTVRARDNGGTANGGADASANQTFTITLAP